MVQVQVPALHWSRSDDLQALRAAPDKPAHPAAISSAHCFEPQSGGAALAPETKTPAASAIAANVTTARLVIVEPPLWPFPAKLDFGPLPAVPRLRHACQRGSTCARHVTRPCPRGVRRSLRRDVRRITALPTGNAGSQGSGATAYGHSALEQRQSAAWVRRAGNDEPSTCAPEHMLGEAIYLGNVATPAATM